MNGMVSAYFAISVHEHQKKANRDTAVSQSRRVKPLDLLAALSGGWEGVIHLPVKPPGGLWGSHLVCDPTLTTVHKFTEDTQLLTERTNVICISDEAHRSQTNLAQKVTTTAAGVKRTFGFAKYLHDSLPNATYVGFTGTPIGPTPSPCLLAGAPPFRHGLRAHPLESP